jgi:hypothetical protein
MAKNKNRSSLDIGVPLAIALASALLPSCSSDTRHTAAEALASTSQPLNLSPQIGNFVLYGQRSVTIGAFGQVNGGDVGVATPAISSFGAQLVVGDHAQVDPAHTLLSPSVTLGAHAQVGDVETSTLVNDGASLGVVAPFPVGLMPPEPLASVSPSSGPSITVGSYGSATLSPGSYGALTVADHSNVVFDAGVYQFASFTVADHVTLTADAGGVTIDVAGTLSLAGWDQWAPAAGASAEQLTILVAGTDGSNGSPSAASIGPHSIGTSVLAAPHGTLAIGDHAQLTGAFAGYDVTVGEHSQAAYQSGLPSPSAAGQQGMQQLTGYVTPAMVGAPLVGPVPGDAIIELAIGLPLRDEPGLQATIAQIYDPSSPLYHQYISPSDFAAAYGPLSAMSDPLLSFINASGLTLQGTYTSNQLFDVTGPASVVGSTFFVTLNYYQRPDGSVFYAPDREPSVDLDPTTVPIARIDGLESFLEAQPLAGSGPIPNSSQVDHPTNTNLFMGPDFRNAYLPGVTFSGATQTVALVELDSYIDGVGGDIGLYEACPDCTPAVSNPPSVGVTRVPIDGLDTMPPPFPVSNEATLDIDMVIALAPDIDRIYVYEAPMLSGLPSIKSQTTEINDILAHIANPQGLPLSNQIACSWIRYGSYNTAALMYQFAMQGQSYFQGSGDAGSYYDVGAFDPIIDPESAYMTLVGGTRLTTAAGKSWLSETTWNDALALRGDFGATGGGSIGGVFDEFSGSVSIPIYQTPIASQISAAGGDPTWRAVPDVSMTASDIGIYFQGALQFTGGTSAAGPLWAAFTALANQASIAQGRKPLGFANPSLYAAGQSTSYTNLFHDIQDLSTNSTAGSGKYKAMMGYDLATGWGTPKGNLVAFLGCAESCGGSGCVDLDSDPANCGVCGNSCAGGQCIAGQCGTVTVGMTATTSGLYLCVVGTGFGPGEFVSVAFPGAPAPSGAPLAKTGVVDGNGQWAYFDAVPYNTACTAAEESGTFSVTESDPDQPSVQFPVQNFPASYFCSPPGAGQATVGPGASLTDCNAPDGASGLFFGD